MCNILEELNEQYTEANFLIVGDFNLPFLTQLFSGVISQIDLNTTLTYQQNQVASLLLDTFNFIGLSQINTKLNIYGSILDLIFCNPDAFSIEVLNDSILPIDKYHPPLLINVLVERTILYLFIFINYILY